VLITNRVNVIATVYRAKKRKPWLRFLRSFSSPYRTEEAARGKLVPGLTLVITSPLCVFHCLLSDLFPVTARNILHIFGF